MITGKFRASFVHVWQPQQPLNGQGDPKYSITMLIPKTDTATLNAIYAEIERAKADGAQKCWNGAIPPVLKVPLYDGDGLRPSGEPFGEECRGCMVLSANSRSQPGVVDINVQPILNQADFYSGCYARADISFFPYAQAGARGVGCGLNNVQKIADGEPLSGRVSPEQSFGGANAYAGVAPAQAYSQSGQQAPPYGAGMPAYGQQQAPPYGTGVPVYGQQQATAYAQGNAYAGAGAGYAQPARQVDPVTGRPVTGGVMGL